MFKYRCLYKFSIYEIILYSACEYYIQFVAAANVKEFHNEPHNHKKVKGFIKKKKKIGYAKNSFCLLKIIKTIAKIKQQKH